jgi:hypothetical protein
MQYSETSTEELRLMLAEYERIFRLIWESDDGVVVIGLTGKIDATEGLARRIRAIHNELESREDV